jgi:D-alanyl-D-alanine carboxypeptidase/D-alanyl-D-alanine-endopeptidase (penicillin-binding protein 4)
LFRFYRTLGTKLQVAAANPENPSRVLRNPRAAFIAERLAPAALALSSFILYTAQPVVAQTTSSSPSPSPGAAPIVTPTTFGDPWTPDEIAALDRDLDAQIAGAASLRGAHVGVLAVDTRTGATLYARAADDEFQPASTFKVVVGSAALDRLGEDERFRTSAALTRGGTLVVHGGGDALLSSADVDALAVAAAGSGIRTVRGIAIDATRYDAAPYAPGWTWDDFTYDYAAKPLALALEKDVVHVHVAPGKFAGAPAKVSVDPPVVAVSSSVVTLPSGYATTADVDPNPNGRLHLSGGIALGTPVHAIDAAVADPRAFVAKAIAARLRAHGIAVRAGPLRGFRYDAPQKSFWSHYSLPLSQLLGKFWIPSDNFVGEMLLKELGYVHGGAPGTTAKGIAYEKHWLASIGIDPATLTLADGCGMSQYDRITPRDLVAIMQHDWNGPYRAIVLDSLPIGGARGTIEGIAGTAAAGRVFAKTGSMMHVRGLTGYVATEHHGAVTFAFSIDDWNGDYASLAATRAAVLSRIVTD